MLRIAVQGGGCSGFEYALGFDTRRPGGRPRDRRARRPGRRRPVQRAVPAGHADRLRRGASGRVRDQQPERDVGRAAAATPSRSRKAPRARCPPRGAGGGCGSGCSPLSRASPLALTSIATSWLRHDGVVDITILGAGPVGLSAAYYAGHRDGTVRIVESLEQLGGQVAATYPEKHVYDVAGHPKILGQNARRPLRRAGAPVRRRGHPRRGGEDARADEPERRGACSR